MAHKNTGETLVRKHLWMFADDWEWIQSNFGNPGNIGTSTAIRLMLRKYINQLKASAENAATPITADSVDSIIEEGLHND